MQKITGFKFQLKLIGKILFLGMVRGVKDEMFLKFKNDFDRLLREAAEKIWAAEAPRIIQDYTDHGIKHYERIIESILSLLNLNVGTILNSKESYLLMAGVYMHDWKKKWRTIIKRVSIFFALG